MFVICLCFLYMFAILTSTLKNVYNLQLDLIIFSVLLVHLIEFIRDNNCEIVKLSKAVTWSVNQSIILDTVFPSWIDYI